MARRMPDQLAVAFPRGKDGTGKVRYATYTFAELDRRSDVLAKGLLESGITRGMRTVLMVKPSLEFFALTFALFKAGIVPVMVDPGMGVANLKECLKEAEPEAFIGITKAHIARVILGWAKGSCKKLVTVGPRIFWGGTTLSHVARRGGKALDADEKQGVCTTPDETETAAILFTSGSTGIPKGVVYTHGIFQDQVSKLKALYGIQPSDIDLPTFPLFALFAPALGMSSVIPDMDFTRPGSVDPEKIIQAIRDFDITNMFGSPALIRRVGFHGQKHGIKLPTLKRVISAGAPAREDSLRAFSSMLNPDAQIFTPYGATESLPVASIGSHQVLNETATLTAEGKGVCVGKTVEGIEVRVIAIDDLPIEDWSQVTLMEHGEIGEIVVKGPNVTREYFRRESSTKLAKIPDNEGWWHRMGDVGYLDESGQLWFCGRKTHRVECGNKIHFTIPVESIFNTHADVFRTALVGIEQNGETTPILCVELNPGVDASEQPRIEKDLLTMAGKHPLTEDVEQILFHPSFPVDIRHNSKIFREKLTDWAQEKLVD